MMNYEIFKEVVKEKILDYLPSEYANAKVEVRSINKINQVKDAMDIRPQGSNLAPTVYLNDLYDEYKYTNDINRIMEKAGKIVFHALENNEHVRSDVNMDSLKENITFMLINTEQNKEMLANVPHREFQDLSIIYRSVLAVDDHGIQSVTITNAHAEAMGLTEKQLFDIAKVKTLEIMPPKIRSMNEVMKEMFAHDGMPEEMIEVMFGEMAPNEQMYVISNEMGVNGAISMLYEDKLHQLAENIETDLYILPSSIHEVIAVSTDMGDPDMLAAMVAEINMDQVALEERLSNQVYHYDKDLRKLSLATDTPNKRLDGKVAEPQLIYSANEKSR